MTDDDLDLVDTDHLVAALFRRHDAVLVATIKDLDAEREERCVNWKGGVVTALGLVAFAQGEVRRRTRPPRGS